jgi:hypothetical protein
MAGGRVEEVLILRVVFLSSVKCCGRVGRGREGGRIGFDLLFTRYFYYDQGRLANSISTASAVPSSHPSKSFPSRCLSLEPLPLHLPPALHGVQPLANRCRWSCRAPERSAQQ